MSNYTRALEFFIENGITLNTDQLISLKEKYTVTHSEYPFKIGNKTYILYNCNENLTDKQKEVIKNKMIKLLKSESKIKDQVYKLYKDNYTGDYEKDKERDYIDSFELIPDGKATDDLGIFLSNINQFYTVYKNGKIDEKQTFVY